MCKDGNNSNATPSLLGWDFQINAAIALFMYYLRDVKSVRVEGKLEDIELTFNDNSKFYSQAKHVERPDNYNTVLEHLTNALRTLDNDSTKKNVNFLGYITNSPNPFSNQRTMSYFTQRTILKYEELPDMCKKKISELVYKHSYIHFDENKFIVYTIPFYGENPENRYKEIKTIVSEKLGRLNVNSARTIDRILEVWQRDYFHNATNTNTSVNMSKQELIWPLILVLMDENDAVRYREIFNEDDYQYAMSRYRQIINYQTINYQLITRVLADYNKKKKPLIEYIDDNWSDYRDIVVNFDNDDTETLTFVIRIILYKILIQREVIKTIKQEVGI